MSRVCVGVSEDVGVQDDPEQTADDAHSGHHEAVQSQPPVEGETGDLGGGEQEGGESSHLVSLPEGGGERRRSLGGAEKEVHPGWISWWCGGV